MTQRSAERIEFLQDVLVGAIENSGYGWFTVQAYQDDFADITDNETEIQYHVDLDTVAQGIGVINKAKIEYFEGEHALANDYTGERLYLSAERRKAIVQASRDNDAGDLDVVDCLAILECAIFGQVTYA